MVNVGAFTLLSLYKCTPARGAWRREASIQTLRKRTTTNKNKAMRKKFLIGQIKTVRMNRSYNHHQRRRTVQQQSNVNGCRSIDGSTAIVWKKIFCFTFAKNLMG